MTLEDRIELELLRYQQYCGEYDYRCNDSERARKFIQNLVKLAKGEVI